MSTVPTRRSFLKRVASRGLDVACGSHCVICGLRARRRLGDPIDPRLVKQWGLTAEQSHQLYERERSVCRRCGSSMRSAILGKALLHVAQSNRGVTARSLSALMQSSAMYSLSIAEINSAGSLHKYLQGHPRLYYSEYGSADPSVPHEDIQALSLSDGSFDIVITSETLEHVPDPIRALGEIRRVLKPGGAHVFTIPVIPDGRATVTRAVLVNGELVHCYEPSYHGPPGPRHPDRLVFHEFGLDFEHLIEQQGDALEVVVDPYNVLVRAYIAYRT